MLISVIVPLYNVECYLKRCIESILNQTYNELEIILVDDGSSDRSGEICDNYAQKDSRIKVIHKKNGGLSDARNVGLDCATGELLAFVDSDDYINKRTFEILYHNLVKYDADISVCDYKCVYDESAKYNEEVLENNVDVYADEQIEELLRIRDTKTLLSWNKLYRRHIFENYRYPIGRYHEDQWAVHYILLETKCIVYTDAKLYYYYQRTDSITHTDVNYKRLSDLVGALEDSFKCYDERGLKSLQLTAACNAANCCMFYYIEVRKNRINDRKMICSYIQKEMKYIVQYNRSVLSYKQFPYFLFLLCPQLAICSKKMIDSIMSKRRNTSRK